VKSRYFERAYRGAGLTHAPIFGACSSARLAFLRLELERTNLMTRCVRQVWRRFGYIYTAVAALSLYKHDVAQGLLRTKMSCTVALSDPSLQRAPYVPPGNMITMLIVS